MIERSPGLYIHIPFCGRRCGYCDFYSIENEELQEDFFNVLTKEARLYSRQFSEFGTIYLGGGTPSFPDASNISALLEEVSDIFSFQPDREITIEVNPDDISREKIESYRRSGVGRVSMGVQSFDEGELVFLQRRHDSEAARRAIVTVREAGVGDLGLDLIFGFHNHSEESWRRTLEEAVRFLPEHISCYQMTISESTDMGRLLAEGKISEISDELQRSLFLLADEILTANGYLHYEVSNFAREERFISRHNSRYWNRTDYLGLGPSAHSLRADRRWWNIASVEKYCDLADKGISCVSGEEELSPEQISIEDLYLGLRTAHGVPLSLLSGFAGGMRTVDELIRERLLFIRDDRAIPTIAGFLVADTLPLLFL
ncbi:MAG: radical SAM family heme chaperone HemW [Candidatus Krumholzibacteriota bacterium]|nr:radical SAM family heme chaperone HemW [Candidatus Krumholzibacteriota bacterium]